MTCAPFPKQNIECIPSAQLDIKAAAQKGVEKIYVVGSGTSKQHDTVYVEYIPKHAFVSCEGKALRGVIEQNKNCFIYGIEACFADPQTRVNHVLTQLAHKRGHTFFLSQSAYLALPAHKRHHVLRKLNIFLRLLTKAGVAFYYVAFSDCLLSREEKESFIRVLLQ